MKRISIVTVLVMTVVFFFGCGESKSGITVTGSTTVLPLAQACAEKFMQFNKGIGVSVKGGGSGVGIAALIDGRCDIAESSRSIKDKERNLAKEKGVDIHEIVIARDGIAVVVNKKNPIKLITLAKVKDIYTGKIGNWKEIGGLDQKIVIISRDTASGTFESFKDLVLKKEKVVGGALMLASNKAIASTVQNTPGAIGYVGIGFLSDDISALSVDGVLPSNKTVNDNTYKISRALYMYTNGKPVGNAKKFIDYILSPAGQKIVGEVGYVPLNQ